MVKEGFCGPSGRMGASAVAAGVAAIDVTDILVQLARLLGRAAARDWLLDAAVEAIDDGAAEQGSAR